MKKYVLSVFFLAGVIISNAQEENTFELSEEESLRITESFEFNNMLNYQLRFLEIVNGALSQGIPLSSLKAAAKESIESGDDEIFWRMVFPHPDMGRQFMENFVSAKKQFFEANNQLMENRDAFICSTCPKQPSEEVDVFFDIFEKYKVSKPLLEDSEQNFHDGHGYTCGSAWNRVKLGMCAFGCSYLTGGLGVILCGWRCWCGFCKQNSELSTVICGG
jgi:hypothetical protein